MRFWIIISTIAIIKSIGHIDDINLLFLFLFGLSGLVMDLIEFKDKVK